ncbi:MAG: hypothetical protein JNL11_10605 [Bdellovibrionaceae bacterium]|nr:hypothetical protein [Pseudobdellovibrionaceae bacterium]
MVDDLENVYGSSYVDNGIIFNLSVYRNLIKKTKVVVQNQKIINVYQEVNTFGNIVSIRELVDAVNYFPKENTIHLYHKAWDDKYKKKELNDLKVLIHHEFIPYFTGKAGRDHKYSKKIRAIYNPRFSFENLKPGFYEVLYFDDPIFSVTSYFYWMYVSFDKHTKQLSLQTVEDPLKGVWCFDCYFLPVNYVRLDDINNKGLARISSQSVVLSMTKEMGIFKGFDDVHGYPYVKMLTEDSFGFGFMDADYKGSLEQWTSQNTIDSRLVVLTRVSDVNGANWLKENKKIPFGGLRFSKENKSCEDVHRQLITENVNLCNTYATTIMRGIDLNSCQENNVKIIDVKQGRSKKMFESFHCAYVSQLQPAFVGIPSNIQSQYQTVVESWQYLLEEHKYYSR